MLKTSIIIPNWNGADKLKKNLPAVLQAAKHSNAIEVIVVDDASTDNSLEILRTQFSEVKVVEKSVNSGFSTTVNLGVKHAKGDIVVQLNSDAKPWENFLRFALPHFEDKQVFSVGCNVGGVWNLAEWKDGFFWHHQADRDKVDMSQSHQTLWSSGGSGVFRKDIWQELGGLDELFDPFYEEDLDIGYRATKRGYINIWEPKSLVEHYKEPGVIEANFSASKVALTAQRNQLQFIWKNITSAQMMAEHQRALVKMIAKHPKYLRVFAAAMSRYSRLMAKRKIEQKHAKLTDEEVLAIFRYTV